MCVNRCVLVQVQGTRMAIFSPGTLRIYGLILHFYFLISVLGFDFPGDKHLAILGALA